MNNKYLILLLFIFLVFLMGSINSTITNNFYNNTTGSQDHAVLSNLSYAESNHTGFQASDTLDNDVAGLGYVTNITGNFLNLTTGGDISGTVTIEGIRVGDFRNYTQQGFDFNASSFQGMFSGYNDTNCMYTGNAVNAYYDGVFSATQGWHKQFTNYNSWIVQSQACNYGQNQVDLYASAPTTEDPFLNFVRVYSFTNTSATIDQPLTLTNLTGLGNAYTCVNATGYLYRGSPTC